MPAFVSPQMVSPTLIGRAAGMLSDIASSSPGDYATYALTTRFKVQIMANGISDLGGWASCKGLKIDFKVKQVQYGGDYTSSVLLPERLEYEKIVLERGIEQSDTQKLQKWLKSVIDSWMVPTNGRPSGSPATITLVDPTDNSAEIAHWKLRGVYPVSWSGPSMSASGSDAVATETLVLQHGGFEWPQ